MPTIRQLNATLEESESMKGVASAYGEIAAMKLQKIRAGIEKNRSFFQEVTEVYHIIRVNALKRHIYPPQTSKRGTISILITSNQHFYGDLENRLTKFFIVNTSKISTDRLAIGRTALGIFHSMNYFHPYQPMVFKKDLPDLKEIAQLVAMLNGYQQISVYYSRMQSVMVQEPHLVDIIQKPPEYYLQVKAPKVDYIFEPEIAKMITFFDNQITALLVEQTFLESELARTAARLVSMDQAQLNADDLIAAQKRLLGQEKRSLANIRLMETVIALRKWRKEEQGI